MTRDSGCQPRRHEDGLRASRDNDKMSFVNVKYDLSMSRASTCKLIYSLDYTNIGEASKTDQVCAKVNAKYFAWQNKQLVMLLFLLYQLSHQVNVADVPNWA